MLDPLPSESSDLFSGAHEAVDEMRATARDEADQVAAERSFWRELPLLLLVALVAAVLLKTFVLQSFYIPSESMVETLQINDRIMVNKLSYRFGDIKRGQVIVFDDPNDEGSDGESLLGSALRNVAESVGLSAPRSEFIKRVIALPGETDQHPQRGGHDRRHTDRGAVPGTRGADVGLWPRTDTRGLCLCHGRQPWIEF